MRAARLALIALCMALLPGCVPTEPFRTQLNSIAPLPKDAPCAGGRLQTAAAQPDQSNHEHTDAFDLYFVEFDELGLLYPQGMEGAGLASCQIDALMHDLDALAAREAGLSIVVYVHGWKHNASSTDGDVKHFRRLLGGTYLVELAKKEEFGLAPHRVVGVFVSWRGDSMAIPDPMKSASFWDRKNTAQRVAEGESRTLFSRLRGFEATQNGGPRPASGENKVFMILMGHSFGGLILFNSISGALINYLYDGAKEPGSRDLVPRFGDMVILANPAVEATRYTPLHRAAVSRGGFDRYQAPVFVSITSTADWATGMAFPLGRDVSTIFETKLSDEERTANRNTMGHVDGYITHELKKRTDTLDTCPGWAPVADPNAPDAVAREKRNLDLETINSRAFFGDDPESLSLRPGWTRDFCGNTTLTHQRFEPNSPIWNVQTDKDIVPDHNDITEPIFVSFVRQIYHDAVIYPLLIERSKRYNIREQLKSQAAPTKQ
jgi:hypothetical protein